MADLRDTPSGDTGYIGMLEEARENANAATLRAEAERDRYRERVHQLEIEVGLLRDALAVAADDLDKAANQFAGMVHLNIDLPIVNNPDIFAAKATRAREALNA